MTTDNTHRNAEIYQLRLRGYSPEEIAIEYGLSTRTTEIIISDVARATTQKRDPNLSKLLELDRLDKLLKKAVTILNRKHVAVSHGRVVYDPETQTPMRDDAPELAAINTILKIMEQRAHYEGTYAPTNITLELPPDPLSIEMQELINEAKLASSAPLPILDVEFEVEDNEDAYEED